MGINAFDTKVKTNMIINEKLCTVDALFDSKPNNAKIHDIDQPVNTANNAQTRTLPKPVSGLQPIKYPVANEAVAAITNRKISAKSCPANGAI